MSSPGVPATMRLFGVASGRAFASVFSVFRLVEVNPDRRFCLRYLHICEAGCGFWSVCKHVSFTKHVLR